MFSYQPPKTSVPPVSSVRDLPSSLFWARRIGLGRDECRLHDKCIVSAVHRHDKIERLPIVLQEGGGQIGSIKLRVLSRCCFFVRCAPLAPQALCFAECDRCCSLV